MEFSLGGRDMAPLTISTLLLSPPLVPGPSVICEEREIDISHCVINLYDSTLLARAQRARQGTAS